MELNERHRFFYRAWCVRACLAPVVLLVSLIVILPSVRAEDWPTYRHDIRRSAVTVESLDSESLQETWVYEASYRPTTAWAGPAKRDSYRNMTGLRSMRNYDSGFPVIVVGDDLYFGSSADDSVHCLDAVTGEKRWSYCTDGPVRIAPTYYDEKIYFGSDDGYAYCVRAEDGTLVWRVKPSPAERLVPSNGKLISLWPCRTGVLVDDGKAYFSCSMLPWETSYFCAVDADTGFFEGDGLYLKTFSQITLEGAPAASSSHIYAPQGRREPRVLDRLTGQSRGTLQGGGGVFALLASDDRFFHAPGNKTGWITESDAVTRDRTATFDGGHCLVVSDSTSYLLRDGTLVAMDRATRRPVWTRECDYSHSLMLAGDVLIAGGDDEIAAFRAADGEAIATRPVVGKVHGLVVANGGLFVSTDMGRIHAFRPTTRVEWFHAQPSGH